MKTLHKLITLCFLVGYGVISHAQCEHDVSTDPNNSHNDQLPDLQTSGPPYSQDQRYLNGLDWWTPNSYSLDNMMYNPTQPYTTMSNIQSYNQNISDYQYLRKDLGGEYVHPDNGWELMLANLGRYPDNVTIHNNVDLTSIPYLGFYNRYTGVFRLFFQYGYNEPPVDAVDGVKVVLEYKSSSASGILRLAKGTDRTLDKGTVATKLFAVAPPAGQINFWKSVDFQLTYDPCVCYYPSQLSIDFEFFSVTDFKLYGRSISIEQDLIDANGNVVNADFLSGIDVSNGSDMDGGYVMYKTMGDLVDDYISSYQAYKDELDAVNQYNEDLEKKLVILKAFKDLVVNGTSAALTAATGMPWFGALEQFAGEVIGKDSIDLDPLVEQAKEAISKEATTFINKFKTKKEPTKPSMPTASFTEMQFSGTMSDYTPVNGPTFFTPGSFMNNDDPNNTLNDLQNAPHGYPVYNSGVGVFALLESPKVDFSSSSPELINQISYPSNPNGTIYFNEDLRTYQMKLSEPLKYTLNPALDIESYTMECSYRITVKRNSILDAMEWSDAYIDAANPFVYSAHYRQYIQAFNHVGATANVVSDSMGTSAYDIIDRHMITSSTPFSAAEQALWKAGEPILDRDCVIVFNSLSVPVDAFNTLVPSMGVETQYAYYNSSSYADPSVPAVDGLQYTLQAVELKVQLHIVYESYDTDGYKNEGTYVFTYPVDPNDIAYLNDTEIVPDIGGSSSDIDASPENLTFTDTYFDGSAIDGCVLNGSTYTCQCWNNLTIDGDITVANGYNVFMLAGNEVYQVNNSQVAPEVVVDIQPILDYSSPTPEATTSYVESFCAGNSPNGTAYQANLSKNHFDRVNDEEDTLPIDQPEYLAFNLYPNPTSSSVAIGFVCSTGEDLHISLLDMTGKTLSTKQISAAYLTEGVNVNELDLMDLSSGYYFVVLKSGNLTKTEKLVIQK
ncbi:T9SS type A sorting domain-containing protein [Parvicella tangerina]|uniref:Secretion system C-terminal sorting domain-containing protein n=1 Tax=Parvicella tangerina TaxID=2829795 RepID=A0A916JQM7_9FLAO|nr:T9SS type A sorting domain-containing protein [Parvicella tangerina]CAG5086964.1 hypothetical protein CRYO30217_03352 [Parvicella tangerina]